VVASAKCVFTLLFDSHVVQLISRFSSVFVKFAMDGEDEYIMITYEGRSRLVERPGTQAAAKALAVSEFDLPRRAEVKFAVEWKGRRVEIGKDSFSVVSRADELFVVVSGTREPRTRRPNPTMTPATQYTMQVFVKCLST
jgi:hypothetical protein